MTSLPYQYENQEIINYAFDEADNSFKTNVRVYNPHSSTMDFKKEFNWRELT